MHALSHLHVARYNPVATGISKFIKPWDIALFDIVRVAGNRSIIGGSFEDQTLRYPTQRPLVKKSEKRPNQPRRYMFVKRDL